MNADPDAQQQPLATVPLTARGGTVQCDLPGADDLACPSTVTVLGDSPEAARAAIADRGWHTIIRDGETLDVCPNHPDEH